LLWRFLRLSSTNWPAATAPSSTRHCRLVSAYIGRTFTRRARADRGRSSVCRECPGFQKCVDQGLKFPRHNGVGHHLKGEDAMCLASSRNSAAVATGVLLTGSRPLVTASLPAAARNGMVSRTCALMVSTARRPHSSARSRHCSRVPGAWRSVLRYFILTSGRTVASLSRRSPKRLDGDSEPCSHHSPAATQKNVWSQQLPARYWASAGHGVTKVAASLPLAQHVVHTGPLEAPSMPVSNSTFLPGHLSRRGACG
jgi:hypothetical protein